MSSILIIDDAAAQRAALERSVERTCLGFDAIRTARAASEAREILGRESFEIILCASNLPDQDCVEFLTEVAAAYAETALLLLTHLEQGELVERARACGVHGSLRRPYGQAELRDTLEELLRK
ncbi:MAG: response regulator [Planctomycetes bacterium]|nr:response regulator [Planctomycetota bacterium]MCB9917595.1 response regulator [Planctomycetota bacterium]